MTAAAGADAELREPASLSWRIEEDEGLVVPRVGGAARITGGDQR